MGNNRTFKDLPNPQGRHQEKTNQLDKTMRPLTSLLTVLIDHRNRDKYHCGGKIMYFPTKLFLYTNYVINHVQSWIQSVYLLELEFKLLTKGIFLWRGKCVLPSNTLLTAHCYSISVFLTSSPDTCLF